MACRRDGVVRWGGVGVGRGEWGIGDAKQI